MAATLSKSERLCGKKAIAGLMEHGKGGVTGCLRYKFLKSGEADVSRILVSVPKRFFKRAVKRNLLKRRLRESYRTQKELLGGAGPLDLMLVYNSKEILDYQTIHQDVADILRSLASKPEEKS